MFQSLTSILTMSAMLLHSILGCCSHHAHACEHGHVVEGCVAGHDQHESHRAESFHSGHSHGHYHHSANCSDGLETEGLAVAHEDGHGDHEPQECPHGPCGFDCEGGDCSFTQSSDVKAPVPGDGGLWFPLAISNEFVLPVTGLIRADRADSGPPRASAACCCRTMTQVWRL